jgi:hypothetical protein
MLQTAPVAQLAPTHALIDPIEPGEDDRPTGTGLVAPAAPKSVCPPVTYNPLAAGLSVPRAQFRDPERARALSRAKAVLVQIRDGRRPAEFTGELAYALERGLITQAEIDNASCISGERRARAALRSVRYGGNPDSPSLRPMLDEAKAAGFLNDDLIQQALDYARTRSIRAWP